MTARAAAWIVLTTACVAAAAIRTPHPAPPVAGEFLIVTADLHVHAFAGDGALPPWDIRREAARRGLDIVAVTNHNQMYALRLDRALFPPTARPLMLPGMELTTPKYHISAIGIREPIDWHLPLADAIRAIHAQGGVAIGAHPGTRAWRQLDDDTLALFDGLEVAHPARIVNARSRAGIDAVFARARRIKPAIAAIGSSDYHFSAPIGLCRTRLLVTGLTADGVLDAIRAGRTVAYDPAGTAFGDPKWIARIDGAGAATAPAAHGTGWQHHVTMAGAWIALTFLVVFRNNSPRTGL